MVKLCGFCNKKHIISKSSLKLKNNCPVTGDQTHGSVPKQYVNSLLYVISICFYIVYRLSKSVVDFIIDALKRSSKGSDLVKFPLRLVFRQIQRTLLSPTVTSSVKLCEGQNYST